MRLRKTDLIEGVPAKALRDVFRQCTESYASLSWYENKLKGISDDPRALVERLLSAGYLQRADKSFALSAKGLRLSTVRFVKAISREEAMTRFASVLLRADHIRTNDRFVCRIEELHLFGSAADPGAIDCSDIDIAIEIRLKPKYRKSSLELMRELTSEVAAELGYALPKGRDNWLIFLCTICGRFLKSRDKYLSLHDTGDIKQLGLESRKFVDQGRLLPVARGLIKKLK
jgi:predicted nucleotidyltransferase